MLSSIRYLFIECEENNDPHIKERYIRVRRKFLENLLSVSNDGLGIGASIIEFVPAIGHMKACCQVP